MPTSPATSPAAQVRQGIHSSLQILQRHRRRMLTFFCVAMALVVVGLMICPREYESESRLFVRIGKENIGVDPTATTGQTMSVQEDRENEITSIMDILDSRVVVERVVDQLGPALILDGVTGTAADADDQLLREKAIRHFRSTIGTDRTKKSNVLVVSYRDRSPELAQQILQTFVDQFQSVHIRANRTSGSLEFFEEQATLLRSQFEQASRELNTAKDKISAVSVEQRRTALQTHLSTIETGLLTTQSELDAANAAIQDLDRTLATLPRKTTTQEVTGFPDDAIGTTRKRVYELELQEQQLLIRYTARHPEVAAVRRQLHAARAILVDRAASGSQATNADNPAWQQLHLRKLEQQSLAAAFVARLTSLQQQQHEIRNQLRDLNGQETQIAELQQRVNLFHDKYGMYSEKAEQARIDQALEQQKISNVNVVQPPTFVAKAVSPRRGLTLIAAFGLSIIGAVCFALLTEFWQQTAPGILSDQTQRPVNGAVASPETESTPTDIAATVSDVEQLVETARY